jgi:molecular chaperone DnaJ
LAATVPFTTLALGGEVTVPTLTGSKTVEVHAATPAGHIFQIAGEGLPHLQHPDSRGKLYVRVEVEVPAKLTDEEKRLLHEFAKLRKESVRPSRKRFFEKLKDSF